MWSRRIQGLIQPDRQFRRTFLSILFVKVRFAGFGVLLKTPSGAVEIQALDARMWSRMIQGLILPDRQFLQTFLSILFVKVRAADFGVFYHIGFRAVDLQALDARMWSWRIQGLRFWCVVSSLLPDRQFPQTFLSILFVKVRAAGFGVLYQIAFRAVEFQALDARIWSGSAIHHFQSRSV